GHFYLLPQRRIEIPCWSGGMNTSHHFLDIELYILYCDSKLDIYLQQCSMIPFSKFFIPNTKFPTNPKIIHFVDALGIRLKVPESLKSFSTMHYYRDPQMTEHSPAIDALVKLSPSKQHEMVNQ